MALDGYRTVTRNSGGAPFTLSYRVEGTPRVGCVVFLHSLGVDSGMWHDEVSALQHDYLTVAPDSRGHGRSRWSPLTGTADWIDDLLTVLADVKVGAVHVVGLSMGGVQAIALAVRRPEVVRSLVLADTFAQLDDEVAAHKLDGLAATIDRLGMERFAENYVTSRLVADEALRARGGLLREAIAAVSKDAYVATAKACFGAHLRDALPKLRVPTLILWGDHDTAAPKQYAEELLHEIPGARMTIIEHAGHLSNIDNPEAFNRAVTGFLDEVDARSAARS